MRDVGFGSLTYPPLYDGSGNQLNARKENPGFFGKESPSSPALPSAVSGAPLVDDIFERNLTRFHNEIRSQTVHSTDKQTNFVTVDPFKNVARSEKTLESELFRFDFSLLDQQFAEVFKTSNNSKKLENNSKTAAARTTPAECCSAWSCHKQEEQQQQLPFSAPKFTSQSSSFGLSPKVDPFSAVPLDSSPPQKNVDKQFF